MANAPFVFGALTEINVPIETAVWETKIIIPSVMKNFL